MIYVTLLGIIASLACGVVIIAGAIYEDPAEELPHYVEDAIAVLTSVGSLAAPLAVIVGIYGMVAA